MNFREIALFSLAVTRSQPKWGAIVGGVIGAVVLSTVGYKLIGVAARMKHEGKPSLPGVLIHILLVMLAFALMIGGWALAVASLILLVRAFR